MEAEPPAVAEGLAALTTGIGLFAGVDTEVPRERPRVAEADAAHRASVGPLPRVDAQVGLQVLHAVEVATALGAVVRAAPGWEDLPFGVSGFGVVALAVVSAELPGQVERFSAHLADVHSGMHNGGRVCATHLAGVRQPRGGEAHRLHRLVGV